MLAILLHRHHQPRGFLFASLSSHDCSGYNVGLIRVGGRSLHLSSGKVIPRTYLLLRDRQWEGLSGRSQNNRCQPAFPNLVKLNRNGCQGHNQGLKSNQQGVVSRYLWLQKPCVFLLTGFEILWPGLTAYLLRLGILSPVPNHHPVYQKEKAWQLSRTKNILEKQTGHPQALLHQGGQTEQMVGAGEERVRLASVLAVSFQEGKNTLAWNPWRVKCHHAAWPWSRTSLYSHNRINVFIL